MCVCGGLYVCMDWFLLYPSFIYRARFINKFNIIKKCSKAVFFISISILLIHE